MKAIHRALATVVVLMAAASAAGAQPATTPPKDPATPIPSYSLESLWQEIDCECDCDCCARIKGLIKKRLKDPRGRPQLSPRTEEKARAKPRRHWRGQHRDLRDLDLSDAQRDRIADLRHRRQLELVDLRADLEKEELKLKRLLRDDDVDERDVRRHTSAIAKIESEIEFNRIMTRIEARRLLDDEQRDKARKRKRR